MVFIVLSNIKFMLFSKLWILVVLVLFFFIFFLFWQCRLVPCFSLCFGFVLRDGVSESQFNQVLNIELEQIMKVLLTFMNL